MIYSLDSGETVTDIKDTKRRTQTVVDEVARGRFRDDLIRERRSRYTNYRDKKRDATDRVRQLLRSSWTTARDVRAIFLEENISARKITRALCVL